MRVALPLLPGLMPFGVIIGMLSDGKGLSLLETLLMSGSVFAGTSQLVALELWADPAPVLGATLAVFVINLRMAPMGAALAPWLDKLRGWKVWGTLAVLVDNGFAMAVAEMRAGGRDAGHLLGTCLTFWFSWMLMVTVGHQFGAVLRVPAGHPVFFAATASIMAIMVQVWRGRSDLLPWGIAGAVALAVHLAGLPAPWPVLAGALTGAAVGAMRDRRRGKVAAMPAGCWRRR